MTKKNLKWHFLYWLLPVLCIASVFTAYAMGPAAIQAWIISPRGFLENVPTLFLLIGIAGAISALRSAGVKSQPGLCYWLWLFIIAMVYFAGEDQNWGQYWFNWEAPEYFLEHNKEKETNLHNMSTWFNQRPRQLTLVWALVACMLVPLGWEWPKTKTAGFIPEALWPNTRNMVPVVVLAIVIELIDEAEKHYSPLGPFFSGIRFMELQELLLAYLMMLYAFYLRWRLSGRLG